jgi:hypothetical protein
MNAIEFSAPTRQTDEPICQGMSQVQAPTAQELLQPPAGWITTLLLVVRLLQGGRHNHPSIRADRRFDHQLSTGALLSSQR